MNKQRHITIIKSMTLIVMVFIISLLHYYTPTTRELLHNIYQRLYYIPILLSCFWFGLRGGLLTFIFAGIFYAPHIFLQWTHETSYIYNQIIEIVMFFMVAILAGSLYDMEKKLREEYKKTSEERDATLKKLQETFERLRLADRLSTLGTLSAEMAHEIKNPLAGMYGSMEILEKEFQKDHPKYEFVQILKKEINRISGIAHKYLDLARPHKPERARHNVNTLIHSVVEIVSKQAKKKKMSLRLQLSPTLPDILIDGEQIKQAIMNVLLNAIQATPENKSVHIASGAEETYLWITVQDEGRGIPETDLPKIFDPLFTTRKEGTGLGLSIAYQIITQHNGQITFQNTNEGGALCKISLPSLMQER